MSDARHTTRLRWDVSKGVAKLHGVSVALTEPPNLGRGPVLHVNYVPEEAHGVVQYAGQPPRNMDADEKRSADALLRLACEGDSEW
jgi:hypothetical protein